MNVFDLRDHLIDDYSEYISSFIEIRDPSIKEYVEQSVDEGLLWPDPLIQLNPTFEPGHWIDELADEGLLHKECKKIFRRKKEILDYGEPLRIHKHQEDAIRVAKLGQNYVLTTGTGSGKSLAYIIPIVDAILRNGSGKGTQAIVVYPMNALANSQLGELEKFLRFGYQEGKGPVTFERYTGQEDDPTRKRIMANPPDILLTNYVMLELILTRPEERQTLVNAAQNLHFLVLDELHTYRGRQGADVAMLVRRVREALNAQHMQCIGTSATLAGAGTFDQQRQEVASVASVLFGDMVKPENVIGETLRRITPEQSDSDLQYAEALKQSIQSVTPPKTFNELIKDPLAVWVESHLGLATDPSSGRLVRAKPRSITGSEGAAALVSQQTGLSVDACATALQKILLAGFRIQNPESKFPVFAFRLHQFISRGDTVYASIEPEADRYLTVHGQKFVPGERDKVLLPLAFCRECGQEYYAVRRKKDVENHTEVFLPRELNEIRGEETGEPGFLYINSEAPWPEDPQAVVERIPEEWVEDRDGELIVKRSQRKNVPQTIHVNAIGAVNEAGLQAAFLPAPFRFCLNCGVSYGARQSSDFPKLTELSSGGRSTDTTILSLSLIRELKKDPDLQEKARKLLSFTDNRQDASLQAGHFNDFIDIILLRSAIFRAVKNAGLDGIHHEVLAQKVFDALALPLAEYASDPEVRFAQKIETERALREVLGYRIYRDLKRGWRITSPNLEQCGLLQIQYTSLDELCSSEDIWQECHPALLTANPATRAKIAQVLLDFMRRELAIKVSYLDPQAQEVLRQLSNQRLVSPWAMDENEILEHAAILYPRAKMNDHDEYGGNVYLSPRGGFGQFLRRGTSFPEYGNHLSLDDTADVIDQLLHALKIAGLVEVVVDAKDDPGSKPGYQLQAAGMVWKAGDGSKAFHDPIRIPRMPVGGGKTNPYFVDFYQTVSNSILGIEAREHTAQVPSKEREVREARFRSGELPVLYCSPTMELGVDISELNAVNMRNVPPTPANYAQRSGRAGRSGQPALVFTYCTVGSPHDQYYFKRPSLMVSGAVTPPRIDLTNEDLIRSHVQAVWLAESGLSLGLSLRDLLDLSEVHTDLPCLDNVQDALRSESIRKKAQFHAHAVLSDIENELKQADWWNESWLEKVLSQVDLEFNRSCTRWRSLYLAAKQQQQVQHAIINDASRSPHDRQFAKRLRQEAESQLELLTDAENIVQSDFYSYRYFASEGFLPGYSFPRLPLSAYIPARRIKTQSDEFLSRPRFLAISEFGPRSIIYHEGSRYIINKVSLPVSETGEGFAMTRAKQCPVCGYLHTISSGDGPDRCEHCGSMLEPALNNLFRLQNVSTKRRDRISSDEEERFRQGFELQTAVRFADAGGQVSVRTAEIRANDQAVGKLTYGHTATLWRINLGWRRRANHQQYGFILDIERGYWARKDDEVGAAELDDPMSPRTARVVPFVEDHKNCLLFEPNPGLENGQIASLQAALKNAIQVLYQLEDNELLAEPLPTPDERRAILFYEAAEGGAGVLRRIVDDPTAFPRITQEALRLCHFDPISGVDLRRAEGTKEDCEAACYNCLMSYYNQVDHQLLDRQSIKEVLMEYATSEIVLSPKSVSRAEHKQMLLNLCQSDFEREWLHFIDQRELRLPTHAQKLIEACNTRPDYFYEDQHVAVYIDGFHHLYPERQKRDTEKTECMEDTGFTVIRFGISDDWEKVIASYPSVFGK
jgi:ATP-dependent helicase YprA (DUF1998 family)/very-short-patch-repair endonuclease